jgi:prepilin-type N-terminal cleavage/methylation domain-containing protein
MAARAHLQYILRHRAGVSLVELVVVVLIMGILAAAATPRFSEALAERQLHCAALRLARDIELARESAQTASAPRTVSFDLVGNRYSLFPDIQDPNHPANPYTVDVGSEGPVVLISAGFAGSVSVTFNGFGVPDAAGQIILERAGQQATIVVEAGSGQVTIQ